MRRPAFACDSGALRRRWQIPADWEFLIRSRLLLLVPCRPPVRENNFDMMHYCNLGEMSHVTEKHIRLHSVPEVCGKGSRCIIAAVPLRLRWRLRRRFILRIRVWRRCRGRLRQRLSRGLLRQLDWTFAPIEPAPAATEGSSLAFRRAAACID